MSDTDTKREVERRRREHRAAYMRKYKEDHPQTIWEIRRRYQEKKRAAYAAALDAWVKEALSHTSTYEEFIKYPGKPLKRKPMTAEAKLRKSIREKQYRKNLKIKNSEPIYQQWVAAKHRAVAVKNNSDK